jgi:hypothetical protein
MTEKRLKHVAYTFQYMYLSPFMSSPPPISPDIQISQHQDTLQITTPDKSLTITLHPFTPTPPAAQVSRT